MSEMVERCVEAMKGCALDLAYWPEETLAEVVRTVLVTAYEPTEAMCEEGYAETCRHDYGETVPSAESPGAVWRRMIDEALR